MADIDYLDLPDWKTLGKHMEGGEEVIEAEYTMHPDACLKCGCIGRPYRHGVKTVDYRDTPHRLGPAVIRARVQRYRCKECLETFLQPLGGLEESRRMTERCAEYIRTRCLQETFTQLAKEVGCVEGTVRSIADEYIAQKLSAYVPTIPRYMGIDETKLDGRMRLVITDVANRSPVDILPDYVGNVLREWLKAHKPQSALVCVTTDMNQSYHSIVGELFPDVPVVVDKFHLLKEANAGIERTRRRVQSSKGDGIRKSWKRRRHQLLKRPENLADFQAFNLDGWLANEPEMALSYQVKERIFKLYDLPKEEAEKEYDAFLVEFPKELKGDFKELLSKMRNWRKQILAYFDYPITNGFTEAMNGVAKVKNRLGRGYGFDGIRARVLFWKDFQRSDYPTVDGPIMRKSLMASQQGRCSSCGGSYPRDELYLTKVGARLPVNDPLVNLELMCGICKTLLHTEGIHFKGKLPTPDSTHQYE